MTKYWATENFGKGGVTIAVTWVFFILIKVCQKLFKSIVKPKITDTLTVTPAQAGVQSQKRNIEPVALDARLRGHDDNQINDFGLRYNAGQNGLSRELPGEETLAIARRSGYADLLQNFVDTINRALDGHAVMEDVYEGRHKSGGNVNWVQNRGHSKTLVSLRSRVETDKFTFNSDGQGLAVGFRVENNGALDTNLQNKIRLDHLRSKHIARLKNWDYYRIENENDIANLVAFAN